MGKSFSNLRIFDLLYIYTIFYRDQTFVHTDENCFSRFLSPIRYGIAIRRFSVGKSASAPHMRTISEEVESESIHESFTKH